MIFALNWGWRTLSLSTVQSQSNRFPWIFDHPLKLIFTVHLTSNPPPCCFPNFVSRHVLPFRHSAVTGWCGNSAQVLNCFMLCCISNQGLVAWIGYVARGFRFVFVPFCNVYVCQQFLRFSISIIHWFFILF